MKKKQEEIERKEIEINNIKDKEIADYNERIQIEKLMYLKSRKK